LMVKKGKGKFVDEEETLEKIENLDFIVMRRMQK